MAAHPSPPAGWGSRKSGMAAGLATITPASGFVTIPSAVIIGLCGGVACYFAVTKLKAACGYEGSLDVFGMQSAWPRRRWWRALVESALPASKPNQPTHNNPCADEG